MRSKPLRDGIRRYRTSTTRTVAVVFGFMMLMMLGGMLSDAAEAEQSPSVLSWTLFAVVVVLTVRTWRCIVRTDDRGVLVRNTFRTQRFPWSEVEDFVEGTISAAGGPSSPTALLKLTSGRLVPLQGLAGSALDKKQDNATHRLVEALRDELSRRRASNLYA